MSDYFIDTPFDRWLIFNIESKIIKSIRFSDKKEGLDASCSLKEIMNAIFKSKNLLLFDYSLLDFNKKNELYKLYTILTKTKSLIYYSDLAYASFGSKKYARKVARMLHFNPFVFIVPCHRVIAKANIGGYAYGVNLKIKILEWEGLI